MGLVKILRAIGNKQNYMPNKYVLIITYYWPPAGGPGVQRWLKFCKYLPESGIIPIVYCPENPTYPIIDDSLNSEISTDIEVIKAPISEPYKTAGLLSKNKTKAISSGIIAKRGQQTLLERFMLFIRGNLFIPDARKSWVKPSVNILRTIIRVRAINCVVTTGPPHSLHLIGLQLKKELNINWIADFRDPWTTIGYHKSLKLVPKAKKKHLKLEASVLNTADEIIVTSPSTKIEFKAKTNRPISLITNGYDTHNIKFETLDKAFSIAHIGSLLSERNPIILWEILSELNRELRGFKNDLKLNFAGIVSEDVVESINNYNLSDNLNLLGYISHNDAIRYQLKTQLLLLIEIDSEATKAIIPGKLFEYLQSNRPIVALGPKGSDIETILKSSNAGHYFNYQSKDELKNYITTCYNKFQEGQLISHAIGIKQYSRQELTRSLTGVLTKYL